MSHKAIQIDEEDNIATVTSDTQDNEEVEVLSPEGKVIIKTKSLDSIPFGHKIALQNLKKGDKVVKYGEVIGVASKDIRIGEWIHINNLESSTVPASNLGKGEAA
ncbi:UxaA family hydrolase [Candidatus Bathyarchaeota archaeon]|nr:UxaA family hydrolase [Candidatus Bathyarchaeota archaeon]